MENFENIIILEKKPEHQPVFVYKEKGHFIIDVGYEIEVCPFKNAEFIAKALERNEIVFVLLNNKKEVEEAYMVQMNNELRDLFEKAIKERAAACKYCSDEI